MMLLRLVSWPYVRRHLLRSLLTTAGIALGVAVFIGMHAANGAVFDVFRRTVDRIAGAAQLQISAGEVGFAEEVLERVQAVPSVAVAVPAIEAVVGTSLPGEGNLLVLAVDMTGDRSLREYDLESGEAAVIDDPLVFLAQPDSLMVTKEFADRHKLGIGSRIALATAAGDREFTIRAVMRPGGMAAAFGGNLAVIDIYAAQHVFARGRTFDRIDLKVREGTEVAECRAELARLLGPGFQVEQPSARGEQFESMLRVYSLTMNVTSLFAMFIGMFIIYNSFAIAVTERRREIGILRALGATRGQIRRLFLVESAVAGLLGSAAGVGLGIALARLMMGSIGGMLEGIYGVSERPKGIDASPELVAVGMAIGVMTSAVAAWLPARNAARVDPVQALQKGKYQVLTAGENRARRLAAAALAAGSVISLLAGRSSAAFYAGYVAAILAALLLTPALTLWLARMLRPALKAARPVEGALAADGLIQAPRRTSGASAALMLSLAQVIGISGMSIASYESIIDWLDVTLNPDLFVTASESLANRTWRVPADLAADLGRVPGVAEVQAVRSVKIMFRETPVLLIAIGVESVGRLARREPVAGDPREMYRLAAAGRGVIVSENFVELQRLRFGEIIDIPTPGGFLRLPIVGIIDDWSDQLGTILLERALFEERWGDRTANIFRVYLQPGASVASARSGLLRVAAREQRLFVLTNDEVRRYIFRLTDQWLGLTYIQIAVAVLVAVLGIVNTLTVSIIDRRRELGVLRAVGGLRRQIRRTVWMEAMSIGLLGSILGLALGAINLYYILEMNRRDFSGMRLEYAFPSGIAVALVPTILAAAFAAALWPAESALRGSLVEALEYE